MLWRDPTGYTISGLGVDIDAQSGTLDPVADIYAAEAFSSREGARDPQSPLASYQATAGIGGSPDRFAPRTAVSEELHVEPGRTYVAYFQNAAAGYYQTPNASRGEDPGGAGWTLGGPYGSRFVRPLGFGGDSWNFRPGDSRRIPLNVYGWPNPLPAAPNPAPPPPGPVLVSTLGQPSNPTSQLVGKRINLEIAYAASFTNGNDAVHTLHGVQIEVTFIPSSQVLGAIRASIYSDGGGEPGLALHELGLRANPQVGVLTFDAPADTTLAAKTTFWLVIDIAHSPTEDFFRTAVTSSTGQDACAIRNWSIGDVAYFREGPGAAWSPNADLLKMAILGERAPRRQPRCRRRPGISISSSSMPAFCSANSKLKFGDDLRYSTASAEDNIRAKLPTSLESVNIGPRSSVPNSHLPNSDSSSKFSVGTGVRASSGSALIFTPRKSCTPASRSDRKRTLNRFSMPASETSIPSKLHPLICSST